MHRQFSKPESCSFLYIIHLYNGTSHIIKIRLQTPMKRNINVELKLTYTIQITPLKEFHASIVESTLKRSNLTHGSANPTFGSWKCVVGTVPFSITSSGSIILDVIS